MRYTMKATLTAIVVGGALGVATLQAAYAPDVHLTEAQQAPARKGAAAMKALNKGMREAIIAEKLALLFSENGRPAYSGALANTKDTNKHYFLVLTGARFVGSDGTVKEYEQFLPAGRDRKKLPASAAKVYKAMEALGDEAILAAFADEATALCKEAAKYHLMQLDSTMRAAVLADMAGLLTLPNGASPYKGESVNNVNGTLTPLTLRTVANKTKFFDAKGAMHDYASTIRKGDAEMRRWRSRMQALWCAQLIGNDDVLELFADEVAEIRRHTEAYEPPVTAE